MALSLLLAFLSHHFKVAKRKYRASRMAKIERFSLDTVLEGTDETEESSSINFRTHGPIIGSAPPVNTRVKRRVSHPASDKQLSPRQLMMTGQIQNSSSKIVAYRSKKDLFADNDDGEYDGVLDSLETFKKNMKEEQASLYSQQMQLSNQLTVVLSVLEELRPHRRKEEIENPESIKEA